MQEYLKRQERNDQIPLIDPTIIGKSFQEFFDQLLKNPEKLIEAQVNFWKNILDLWQSASKRMLGHKIQFIAPQPGDKRFAKTAQWAENAVFRFYQAVLSARRR